MAGKPRFMPSDETAAVVRDMYVSQKLSTNQIAENLGIPKSRARRFLVSSGIELRHHAEGTRLRSGVLSEKARARPRKPMSEATKAKISVARFLLGEKSARGFSQKASGYVEITRGADKGRSVHVVKMEARIGRRLRDDECVHHIDEDRSNNDDDNLALMTRAAHTKLHRLLDKARGKTIERESNGRFT